MKSLISVIVPVYNVANYIKKCTDSIINQTYCNLEIILVDDGSIDGSAELCDKIASSDNRIKVIHKKNGGLSDARNIGIEFANGDFISFIDSDDYIECDMLDELFNNICAHEAEISVCGYDMIYPSRIINISEGDTKVIYTRDEAFRVLVHRDNIGVIACNKLYKKTLFDNVRYPMGQHFEDINTTYKLIANAKRIVYTPRVLYHYVQRTDSINGKNFKEKKFNYKLYDMEKAADELLDYVEKNQRDALTEISIGCADYYLRIITQELLFKIENKALREKYNQIIRKYRKCIPNAMYLTHKKKTQMLLCYYAFPIYRIIVRRIKR